MARAILDPNASIAQGFITHIIRLNNGQSYSGFISNEGADTIEIRDTTSKASVLKVKDITVRHEMAILMMPPGLVSRLTVK